MDATINLDFEPDSQGRRYPPTVHPSEDDAAPVREKWAQLGLGKWGPPGI